MNVAKDTSIANLTLINANIITLDPLQPIANWLMISDKKIQRLGYDKDLKKPGVTNAKVIDCHGMTVIPGFIDAHFHLVPFAESLVTLNLKPGSDVHSLADIQSRIGRLSQDLPPGNWIRGKGYNEFYLAEKRHPNRWDLDKVAPNHAVKLTHYSGHAHVLNSLALRRIGITGETPDPPGGIIDRDLKTGKPTGLLYEMGDFLSRQIPSLDKEKLEKAIEMANRELISHGITTIHDASSRNDRDRWNLFKSWKERGILSPRVNIMLGIGGFKEHKAKSISEYSDQNQLRISGVKLILDETTGRLNPPQAELNELVFEIHRSGLQVAIHAIEEKAIESACSAIEYALKNVPRSDHRHRIEHCSVCPPSLAKCIASLGIRVVTQPSFIYYNGDRYLETVPGSQFQYLYPLETLIQNGVKVTGSSDCPISSPDPLIGVYAAISRISETGKKILKKEGISAIEALRMYTEYAAEASFEETIKGTLTPGKLADLVVLNGDPTRLPPDDIRDLNVEMTILGGEVVWERNT